MSVMESMEPSKPRPRRSFTPEFKAEIVELCRRGDRSIGQVTHSPGAGRAIAAVGAAAARLARSAPANLNPGGLEVRRPRHSGAGRATAAERPDDTHRPSITP
jgi:hypothetical protein